MKADVTVLMAVYNEEKYVGATIESILAQTYKNFAFIIIDDGSTDGTWQAINSFKDLRIKAIHHDEHGYLTKRLNEGLRMTATKFFARMDSHNLADRTRLEKQRDYLLSHPGVVLVGSNFVRRDEAGKTTFRSNFPLGGDSLKNKLMERNCFKHASWFARYDILEKEGFYNESFRFSQDYELILRLGAKYPLANLPGYLVAEVYTKEAASQTHRLPQAWLAFRAQVSAYFKYPYPCWQGIYLLRGLAFVVKSAIWQLFFWFLFRCPFVCRGGS